MAAEPIWKRLGFTTRNQYRNAQAREVVNPDTGKHFTSYRQLRDYRAKSAGKPRNYTAERQRRDRVAQSKGYRSAARREAVRRAAKRMYGITLEQFDAMERANARHAKEIRALYGKDKRDISHNAKFPIEIQKYKISAAKKRNAPFFVGYVVTYYHSFVDDKTNWYTTLDDEGVVRTHAGLVPGEDVNVPMFHEVPESNEWWREYFVNYGEIYSTDEYDSRYGIDA